MMKNLLRYLLTKIKFPNAKVSFSAKVSLDSSLGKGVTVFENCRLGLCKIAPFTYIGSRSQLERTIVGSFTSIGSEVLSGLATHPLDYITTYPGFYTKQASGAIWFGNEINFNDKKHVEIGSDVWIGTRTIIMGGITIGHGAVIGAGSIVTKNVPPYSIVVGSPAKIIRYRFSDELISKLLESEWWLSSEESLRAVVQYANEPEKFLKELSKAHY